MSSLQKIRLSYQPLIPNLLKDLSQVCFQKIEHKSFLSHRISTLFPNTCHQSSFILQKGAPSSTCPLIIGVLFSGGPASGGHNVIAGLFDGLKKIHPGSHLIGFLGGIEGLLKDQKKELFKQEIASFRNQGGFDLLGTGRGKIETEEELGVALKVCRENKLDGLVIIGGDDSNTNGAILAEYFLKQKCQTKVIGIPKTIDGDLRSADIEISFGFDSACKTYSEMIGNIQKDALSAKKYYHFIKLMGRSASHICLECALNTQPNLAFIGEEKKSLKEITQEIVDLICLRSKLGKDYGVILIPEGLVEFIPEMKALLEELNLVLRPRELTIEEVLQKLKEPHKAFFLTLPEKIQKQLLSDRDPHGNVRVSQIEIEQLLVDRVTQELKVKKDYKGKFVSQNHFLGYEGRACFPSNFDANYAYSLGLVGAISLRDQLTGIICSLQKLSGATENWEVKAVPIVQLIDFEMRKGKEKPVIKKYVVDTESEVFLSFKEKREKWKMDDCYEFPGPIQFFGDLSLTNSVPMILRKSPSK
jgi:pyrophosphate--fructose-6-phosphate 1-phosphotransferase